MNAVNRESNELEAPAVDQLNGDSPTSDKRAEYVRPFVRRLQAGQTKFGSHSLGHDSTFSS